LLASNGMAHGGDSTYAKYTGVQYME
jgi:hypothetical protein